MKSEFKTYQRTNLAEMREVTGLDIETFNRKGHIKVAEGSVSISEPDLENGSPKIGDMIARNPKNHSDQWLVSKQYFEDNFELYYNPNTQAFQS